MKQAIVIFLSAILSGCILPYPHNNWTSPQVSGRVTDGVTGFPIQGAEVYIKGDSSRKVTTNYEGYYEIPPKKDFDWFVFVCPGPCDAMSGNFVVVATHTGYGPEEEEVSGCIGHPSSVCNGRKEHADFILQKSI
ncbi:hypothetical protein [Simiduia litorea]|uniref:hypothetical protein n=1 Tax=Simiduia litorea TaxID=1435348 RepID=UPI0036F372CC